MTVQECREKIKRLRRELSQLQSDLNKLNKEVACCLYAIKNPKMELEVKAQAFQRLHTIHPDKAFELWSCPNVGHKLIAQMVLESISKQL
jgi:predicted nuclease with TOPRIM domain